MEALSFLQSVAGYARAQAQSSADRPIKLGTVDPAYVASSFPGTLPKVTFDGEATLSGKLYPVMAPYWPQPSDRVVLVPIGNTYLIIGCLDSDGHIYVGGDVKLVDDLDVPGDLTIGTGNLNVEDELGDLDSRVSALERMEQFGTRTVSVAAGGFQSYSISFSPSFPSAPHVCISVGSGRLSPALDSVTTSGFNLNVNNWTAGNSGNATAYWHAIEK